VSKLLNKKLDILMVGVDGQGIVLASDILAELALSLGLDVKKADTLGMAQRGGSVTSHLRMSDKVESPLINIGESDIILAFEKLEAARWVSFIKTDGLVIINNLSIPPLSISQGTQKYPLDKDVIYSFHPRTHNVHVVEGTKYAGLIGDNRTLNVFMLGYLSSLLPFNVGDEIWNKCLTELLPAKVLEMNINAFNKGREVASSVNIR
jgi:indolepyruvate ferredoxin oxidoreductase, beta subunit